MVPGTGITGRRHLAGEGPYRQPTGWGLHTSPEGRPICVVHHPVECSCLSDRPTALLYVRRQAAVVNGRTVARTRLARCYRTADRLGAHVLGRFLDDGSAEASNRPGLDALLAAISLLSKDREARGPVLYVITEQPAQLSRSIATAEQITGALAGTRARLVYANEVPS